MKYHEDAVLDEIAEHSAVSRSSAKASGQESE